MPITPPDPLSIAHILQQIFVALGFGSVVLPKVLRASARRRRR